jgi:uncharacterized sulfatase
MVIFTSDHGDMLESHSIYNKGPAMYDEITHIPFIVRWPEKSPQNVTCVHPVSHINVVPTILDAAGLQVPDFLEGKSILETLEKPQVPPNDAVFMEYGRYEVNHDGFGAFQPLRCVYDGRYKLVINLLAADELYDTETDPEEMNNLINSQAHTDIRNKLHDRLLDWMNETRDPFRGWYWETRPWRPDKTAKWDGTGYTRSRRNDGYQPRVLDYETGMEVTEYVRKK